MDLKLFLPLDTSPVDKRSSVAYDMPDKEMYNPSQFSNSVFQQSKANLIWDATDPNQCTMYNADQLEEINLKQYLASDSEGEVDSDVIPVAGPAANQLDSAFQPYRGRLKGLQGQLR